MKRARNPWPFDQLNPLAYDVIVADPPWDFENYSAAGTKKGADPHYAVMPLDAIKALPVHVLARGDCLLLLWTTGWAIAEGHAQDVARAWGFKPLSEMVWRKVTVNGKPRIGTGYRVRTMHEPILVCALGNPRHKPFPSCFDGVAREHSRKPEEFYALVVERTPLALRRADLFSRQTRRGFDGWGREHGKFDSVSERLASRPLAVQPRTTTEGDRTGVNEIPLADSSGRGECGSDYSPGSDCGWRRDADDSF